jgi:hypothetical protein
MAAGGDDVELVRTGQKLVHIEWRLTGGCPRGFGADASEESGRRRPDARELTFFGREHSVQERYRGMLFAVSFGEFVQEIVSMSFVDTRRELSD